MGSCRFTLVNVVVENPRAEKALVIERKVART